MPGEVVTCVIRDPFEVCKILVPLRPCHDRERSRMSADRLLPFLVSSVVWMLSVVWTLLASHMGSHQARILSHIALICRKRARSTIEDFALTYLPYHGLEIPEVGTCKTCALLEKS